MRLSPKNRWIPRAFTLIELLVVVTIIVVLLALLTPALDKAIYQAELATCAARLDGLGMSVMTYASSFKRWYPVRGHNTPHRQPHRLVGPDDPNLPLSYADERIALRGFVDLKLFLDPLTAKIELTETDPRAEVYTPYVSWYGWFYLDPNNGNRPFPRMNRVGDRVVWNAGGASPTYRFNVLASDYDEIQSPNNVVSNHPDRDGLMNPQVLENQPSYGTLTIYISRWTNISFMRGPLDLNFAMDDGSVLRFSDVRLSESKAYPTLNTREGLVPTPQNVRGSDYATWYTYLPKGN